MKFDCGCQYDRVDWDNDVIPLNCSATWDMVGQGLTKGMFQLEKSLGKKWCKKIKPRSISELADVISLIRPGCLEAQFREDPITGKMLSITASYLKVRNRELQAEFIHPVLEPILKSTYGTPVYQEQIMKICEEFAGFSLEEADEARKAVGKKDKAKMEVVHEKFIRGAVAKGNNEEMAEFIFSWIDKFSGYGFNKSHAVGYAMTGYFTAYSKMHFPIEFFKGMLEFSDGKQDEYDEIKELVHEARLFGIDILLPDARKMNEQFEFLGDDKIVFGLAHIKNVGPSSLKTLGPLKDIKDEVDLLSFIFTKSEKYVTIKKDVLEALIKSGALDYCIPDRVRTLARFRMLNVLTPREVGFIIDSDGLLGASKDRWLRELIDAKIPRPFDKRLGRINLFWGEIEKELNGNRKRLSLAYEKFHLGMAISGSEVDLYSNHRINTTCRDFLRIKNKSRVTIGALIEDVRKINDKNNRAMCFMKISDSTYMIDGVVVFSSVYNKCGWIIEPGKAVLIHGKKQDTSLLVDSIEHL